MQILRYEEDNASLYQEVCDCSAYCFAPQARPARGRSVYYGSEAAIAYVGNESPSLCIPHAARGGRAAAVGWNADADMSIV